jgi:serine/threonine protein kinase
MCKFTKEIATLWYRAPELMFGDDNYGTGVDIWAVGCIMAEILTNKPLLAGDCQIDMLFKIMQVVLVPY